MSSEIFKYTSAFLVANGYRAIGITLRGFGRSDASEKYDLEMHARDVHTVLDTLQLEDAVLGGYSFGGVIAAYYVAQYHFPHGKQAVTDQRQCTEVYAAG
jgi:pimeloyl-ACP methyl ester carboxylesterase